MQVWFWIVLGVVFKLPVIGMCWICWHAINDVPDQVIGDGDGGLAAPFGQGPRRRDPHSGVALRQPPPRRSDPGHAVATKPVATPTNRAPAGARRGD